MHLILGASGLVGCYLYAALKRAKLSVMGTCFHQHSREFVPLDIRNTKALKKIINQYKPGFIYLPAALTNVDYCETYPEESYQTNVRSVISLIQLIKHRPVKLIYFSTDYIFNGQKGPYREEDSPDPVNIYGKHKLAAEIAICSKLRNYLIVRTSVVFGWDVLRKSFVVRVLDCVTSNREIKVAKDQNGSAVYSKHLAEWTVRLVQSKQKGIFNVANRKLCSRYELACAAVKHLGGSCKLVKGALTREIGQKAKRPMQAGFRLSKIERCFPGERIPTYVQALKEMATERRSQQVKGGLKPHG